MYDKDSGREAAKAPVRARPAPASLKFGTSTAYCGSIACALLLKDLIDITGEIIGCLETEIALRMTKRMNVSLMSSP